MGKTWNDYASVPLRVLLGFGFAYHGFPKLFSSQGHAGFVVMLQNIGVPAAGLASWLVGILEFFGGLLLIAGAFVTIISVLGIINMLVAMFTVHLPNGFNFLNITGMTEAGPTFGMPGYEVNILYIAGFLALALAGAGALSVDRWLSERRGMGHSPAM
ncbi:MAG: DoxX family protein [Gemmatimonas sp. SM23_52]|nr:MAG: DoxX family protein [Gemmatimonas sp. SM23_52]